MSPWRENAEVWGWNVIAMNGAPRPSAHDVPVIGLGGTNGGGDEVVKDDAEGGHGGQTYALSQIWRLDACEPRNQSSSWSGVGVGVPVDGLRASRTGWRGGAFGPAPRICTGPPGALARSCPIPCAESGYTPEAPLGAGVVDAGTDAGDEDEANGDVEEAVAHAREPGAPRFGSSSAWLSACTLQ